MAKLPENQKMYFKIGEVSEISGVKPHVLRYWETEFKVAKPMRSKAQQRVYKRSDLEKILLIKTLLYEEKYSIAGAKKKLREIIKQMKQSDRTTVQAKAVEKTKDQIAFNFSDKKMKKKLHEIKSLLISIRDSLE